MPIGSRIRQARLALGLTLEEVSERLDRDVTRAALSKYENDRSVPSARLLTKLAKALGQKSSFFLESNPPKIEWRAYRKHSTLTRQRQMRIQAYASFQVEWFAKMQTLLYPDVSPRFPEPKKVRDVESAEMVAELTRHEWELGDSPIRSVMQLVEDRGALVVEWPKTNGFDGLSGFANASFPVIVVCTSVPADRIRYSMSHELGHLLMDASDVDPKDEERIAHRFAAAFLMPRKMVLRELGSRRRSLSLGELALLKAKYGASMQAWIHRARDLEIIGESQYRNLNMMFRSRGWHNNEPVQYAAPETPNRLLQIFSRAVAEGIVTKERALSVCPRFGEIQDMIVEEYASVGEARRLMRLPIVERRKLLEDIDAEAIKSYKEGLELDQLDIVDEEEYAEEG